MKTLIILSLVLIVSSCGHKDSVEEVPMPAVIFGGVWSNTSATTRIEIEFFENSTITLRTIAIPSMATISATMRILNFDGNDFVYETTQGGIAPGSIPSSSPSNAKICIQGCLDFTR